MATPEIDGISILKDLDAQVEAKSGEYQNVAKQAAALQNATKLIAQYATNAQQGYLNLYAGSAEKLADGYNTIVRPGIATAKALLANPATKENGEKLKALILKNQAVLNKAYLENAKQEGLVTSYIYSKMISET